MSEKIDQCVNFHPWHELKALFVKIATFRVQNRQPFLNQLLTISVIFLRAHKQRLKSRFSRGVYQTFFDRPQFCIWHLFWFPCQVLQSRPLFAEYFHLSDCWTRTRENKSLPKLATGSLSKPNLSRISQITSTFVIFFWSKKWFFKSLFRRKIDRVSTEGINNWWRIFIKAQ